MNNKWLNKIELEYCNGQLIDELEEDPNFLSYLIKKLADDRIPLNINHTVYQHTPLNKSIQLELDISGEGEEFDTYAIEFFSDIEEAYNFINKNNLVLDE